MQEQTTKGWEERFDKKVLTYDKDGGFCNQVYVEDYDNMDFDTDLIKSFISQTIKEEQERMLKELYAHRRTDETRMVSKSVISSEYIEAYAESKGILLK